MAEQAASIEALLEEERSFPPSPEFAQQANINDPNVYEEAERDFEGFWSRFADELSWFRKWDTVLEWDPPHAKWFVGAKTNVSYNCVDRHLATRRNKAAIVWEGEPGDWKVYTYWDLYREVCQFANVLKSLGVTKGDRVTIYLPMVPELPIAMLACARIGAAHSVIFGGFSPDSIRDRIEDSQSKLLITADGGFRRGNIVPLKRNCDEAIAGDTTIEQVVVVRRTGHADDLMQTGRDQWWHDLMQGASQKCEPEPMDAEDMLYMLYTSGTTGKPKGIVHTTAGYMVGTYATAKWIFDLKEDDVYWCTADIGWVTGHSYIVYGPLSNGATTVMYEGSPDFPDRDRWWSIIEKYGCTICYTAPTAIRTCMRWGEEYPASARPFEPALAGFGGRAHQPGGLGVVPEEHRGRPDAGGGHLVADGDGHDTHCAAAGDYHAEAGVGNASLPWGAGRRGGRGGELGGTGCWRLSGDQAALAPPCCGRSMGTRSGSCSSTGRVTPTSTSPPTAPSGTWTGISGCWAGWMTSSTCRGTASAPWRWRAPWWTTPRWRSRLP